MTYPPIPKHRFYKASKYFKTTLAEQAEEEGVSESSYKITIECLIMIMRYYDLPIGKARKKYNELKAMPDFEKQMTKIQEELF